MKLIFKILLISFMIFGLILFNTNKVSAATAYDDVIQLTDTLTVTNDQAYPEIEDIDYSYDWYTEARDALNITCNYNEDYADWCEGADDLAELDFGNDNYLVKQNESQDGLYKSYTLYFTDDWDAQASLNGAGDYFMLQSQPSSSYFYHSFSFHHDPSNPRATEKGTYVNWDSQPTVFVIGESFEYPQYYGYPKILLSTFNFVPPVGYEGNIPPDTYTPPNDSNLLTPEYTYSVNESGLLSVKYLGNLRHFFSGTSLLGIEKMTMNWAETDETLESDVVLAGNLDEKYQLPGAGYYMITISHDQQLSIPPWSEDNKIDLVLMQFYWNGYSPVNGDNIGGCDGICNDQNQANNNKILRAIEQAQFSDGGLQGLIFAPINAIALFPTLGDSCSAINFPLMGENVTMQCIRPMVQASPFGPVYATVSVIITGLMTWWVSLKTFALIKGLQDPDDDKVEVLKL